MGNIPDIPGLISKAPPLIGYHFFVVFFQPVKLSRLTGQSVLSTGLSLPIPNLIDIRFQHVSGLGIQIDTIDIKEGGLNAFLPKIPDQTEHENLVLERGIFVSPSVLTQSLNYTMTFFQFNPMYILICALDHENRPAASWLCRNAYPVNWSVSDLDANENTFLIETMEFSYQQFYNIRL